MCGWCTHINGEVYVHDDLISDIVVVEDGLTYGTKETYQELKEIDVILYCELDKLALKVKEVMETIRKEETNET